MGWIIVIIILDVLYSYDNNVIGLDWGLVNVYVVVFFMLVYGWCYRLLLVVFW